MTTRSIARTTPRMQANFVPAVAPARPRRTNAETEWAHGYDACSNGRPYSAMFTGPMRAGWLVAQADGCWQTYRDEYARLMGA
jgi:hypothetical protein